MKSTLLVIVLVVVVECRIQFKLHSAKSQLPIGPINKDDDDGDDKDNNDTLGFENTNPSRVTSDELYHSDMILTEDQWTALKERKDITLEETRLIEGPDGYPLVPYIFHNKGTALCGAQFKSSSGTIRYPDGGFRNYDNSLCIWIIHTTVPITITFTRFKFLKGQDYLYIRDGEDIGSPLAGKFTGRTLPSPVQISTNIAYIVLKSNTRGISSKLELNWEPSGYKPPPPAEPCTTSKPICMDINCYSSSGTIRHPYNPTGVSYETSKVWNIKTKSPIRIKFVSLDIEDNGYLYIKDSDMYGAQTLGHFTGSSIPSPIQSYTGEASIVFITPSSGTSSGFVIEWEPLGC